MNLSCPWTSCMVGLCNRCVRRCTPAAAQEKKLNQKANTRPDGERGGVWLAGPAARWILPSETWPCARWSIGVLVALHRAVGGASARGPCMACAPRAFPLRVPPHTHTGGSMARKLKLQNSTRLHTQRDNARTVCCWRLFALPAFAIINKTAHMVSQVTKLKWKVIAHERMVSYCGWKIPFIDQFSNKLMARPNAIKRLLFVYLPREIKRHQICTREWVWCRLMEYKKRPWPPTDITFSSSAMNKR